MSKYYFAGVAILIVLSSCERVIEVDLNSSDPALVIEAVIFKDSVSLVRLTTTTNYFSSEKPGLIEDARVKVSEDSLSEQLIYKGNGYYNGKNIIGIEGKSYKLEVIYNGVVYKGTSIMPEKADIISVYFSKSDSPGILNPNGETIFTITCNFSDNPDEGNFYMIRFISHGELLERYYMITENSSNSGSVDNSVKGIISFSESIFYNGGQVEVQLFSIDESVYKYFLQMSDVLFWKRRVMPPTPYNPKSNISNGTIGYFAAWTVDSDTIILE